jgi:hypothetical protein
MVADNLFRLCTFPITSYRYSRKVDHYHSQFTISVLLDLEDMKHIKVISRLFYGQCEVHIVGQYSIPFEQAKWDLTVICAVE